MELGVLAVRIYDALAARWPEARVQVAASRRSLPRQWWVRTGGWLPEPIVEDDRPPRDGGITTDAVEAVMAAVLEQYAGGTGL
jgi:hypothetical protein